MNIRPHNFTLFSVAAILVSAAFSVSPVSAQESVISPDPAVAPGLRMNPSSEIPGSYVANHPGTALQGVRDSFVEATVSSYSPSDEVTANFLAYSENGRAAIDVLLMQLYLSVQLPEAEVARVMGLFDFDRRQWRDIDYTDMSRGGWDMTLHITRIYALAKSYRWEGSPYHLNPELGRLLHLAAGWWFDNRPVNPNWWHNDIGVPKKLAAAMLLIRDELSEKEMEGTLRVLERSRFGRTGQNKAWLAGNQLMKALLIDDPELAREARRQIEEEIYVTDSEGIQTDWSFHQHGPQVQFGNYGLAYAEGISFWARVLQGTDYAFGEERMGILENFILNGLCWTVWNGIMDPSACGRQLHIDGGRGKAYSCAVTMLNMAALDRPLSGTFRHIALQNLQPQLYRNELVGARYYPRSDFGIFRTKDWYASVRMQSERTIGYEFTNAENQLAQFSADGVLLLMQSGREYENIFPYWDWRMLPGVTAYEDGAPLLTDDGDEAKRNNSLHAGGLAEDGDMVTTMEVSRNGIHAFKSNFFFDGIVLSLGSDIRASRAEISRVTTTIDQNRFAGEVKTGSFRSETYGRTGWAWHDGRGYVSLDGARMLTDTPMQKGSWAKMAPMYTQIDSGRVFKCWFEHPADGVGSYAYAVLPCRDAAATKAFAKAYASGKSSVKYSGRASAEVSGKSSEMSSGDASGVSSEISLENASWKSSEMSSGKTRSKSSGRQSGIPVPQILCNTADCQAVACAGKTCAVVHNPGEYRLGGTVRTFSSPGIYIIDGEAVRSEPLPPPVGQD